MVGRIAALSAREPTVVPQEGFIGFLIIFFLVYLVLFFFAELFRKRPEPRSAYCPPPIPRPPTATDPHFAVDLTDAERDACLDRVDQLTAAAVPGWPYRVALALLDPQLAVLRNQFDRLLVGPGSGAATKILDWSDHQDYSRVRTAQLQEMLARLSALFSADLTAACEAQRPDQIRWAVNEIARSCQRLYQWGLDHHQFRYDAASDRERPLGSRVGDHVFRQVEMLVAELRRSLADPQFAGPLLFRAEFYVPETGEVDRPVLAVISPPRTGQRG